MLLDPLGPPYPTPRPGDVWEHVTSGDRVRVMAPTPKPRDVWEDASGQTRITITEDGGIMPTYWARVDRRAGKDPVGEYLIARFPVGHGWRLIERDGKSWPPAPEQEPTREAGVEPATDEDIADDEAMCLCDEPLDWDEECTREAVLALIARVRQEQAWRLAETESATISALSEAAMGERLRTAERERDEAVARAEKAEVDATRYERMLGRAEAEVARMRPVVDAAVNWDMAMVDLDDLAVAVTEYRAARKEAGGKSWPPPAQERQAIDTAYDTPTHGVQAINHQQVADVGAKPRDVAPGSKSEGGSLGVEPATDEQIEEWDGWPLTTHRASMVIARVRQEQARADGEERARHQIEDERDEAVARAEKAEREIALARRIDNVRTMCADAQVIGGHLRPDAVLYVLDGEGSDA